MKRTVLQLLSFILCLCLSGCTAAKEALPEPTPNPLETYSGQWTWECGDGGEVWTLYDDGRVLLPPQSYDGYRTVGGFGSWTIGEEGLLMTFAETYPLYIREEDGFQKLYCPLLNQTLVRVENREAAYGAKFVDVELNAENVWNYFRLERVPYPVDENGQPIYKEVFVMRNAQYENGLVYWSESDVRLDFIYWTTYHLRCEQVPYGVNFYVDDLNGVTAKGRLTFVRADHIADYVYDGNERVVVLNSGETSNDAFETFRYGDYPY